MAKSLKMHREPPLLLVRERGAWDACTPFKTFLIRPQPACLTLLSICPPAPSPSTPPQALLSTSHPPRPRSLLLMFFLPDLPLFSSTPHLCISEGSAWEFLCYEGFPELPSRSCSLSSHVHRGFCLHFCLGMSHFACILVQCVCKLLFPSQDPWG